MGGWSARVIVAFVGYIGASSFGLGAAKLIELGYAVTVLWLTLFLLGILLLLLRWSFGLLTVTLAGGLVYIVGRYTPTSAQVVAAYAISGSSCYPESAGYSSGARIGDGGDLRQLTLIRASSGSCSGWRPRSRRSPSAANGWSCEPEARTAVRPAMTGVAPLSPATADISGRRDRRRNNRSDGLP